MEIAFIPVKIKIKELKNIEKLLEELPKKIGIVCLIQYLDVTKEIISNLKKNQFDVLYKEPLFILGCNVKNADLPVDDILLIGDGKFHALEIIRELNKNVILYNPVTGEIRKISKEEYKKYITNIKYLIEKFKASNNIGILISIKPGQYDYSSLKYLIKNLKNKNIYLFISDNIDFNQFLNFPYIDFWIIIACPRIIDDIIERGLNAITIDLVKKEIENLQTTALPNTIT